MTKSRVIYGGKKAHTRTIKTKSGGTRKVNVKRSKSFVRRTK